MNATRDGGGPLNGPLTINTLLAADRGDGSGAWLLSLMAQLLFPRQQVWGDVAAVGRSDAAAARRYFGTHADRGSVIGSPGTDLIWSGGRLVDSWPANPDETQAISYVDYRGLPTRDELLAHYRDVSGRQVDDIDYYCVLAKWKLAVVLEQTVSRGGPKGGSFAPIVKDLMAEAGELAASVDYKG